MSERLTTDNPQNMTDSMLNLAYAEDKWVHIRGMKEPFTDYIKSQCRKQGCDLEEMSDDELAESVMDCGFDHPECPIFLLHTVATQAAELRARLKHFEDLQEQGRLVELPHRDYTFTIRGDIALDLIRANCRAATKESEAQAVLDRMERTKSVEMSQSKSCSNCKHSERIDGKNEMIGCTKSQSLRSPLSLCGEWEGKR